MSQEAIERERIGSLVEVIHAVLISLEDLDPSGASRLREYWGRVVTRVQQRISSEAEFPAPPPSRPAAAPAPAPAPPPAEVDAPASDSPIGMGSIDLFLGGVKPGAVQAAREVPPEPAPSADDADFFADLPPSSGEAARPEPAPADPEATARLEELRLRVEELERENDELRTRLSEPAPALASPGLSPASVLGALKVDASAEGLRIGEQELLDMMGKLSSYFDGTDRNLTHVFSKLKLTVNLERFDQVLARSLRGEADLVAHTDMLRDCWKILVGGTWNSLRGWCEKLQESLEPAQIERIAKEQKAKPWVVYSEIYQRMSLYNNLIELLRTKIKAQIRDRQPGLLS